MSDFIQVATTTDREEEAQRIARALVERRLAACVHVVGPIRSTYWWQDQIETAEEWRLEMKTRRALLEPLQRAIRELHSYDVPEIIAVPIEAGSEDYLEWLRRETEPREQSGDGGS